MNKEQCFLLDCLRAYLNGTSINDEYEMKAIGYEIIKSIIHLYDDKK